MSREIRLATPADAPAFHTIYAPIVRDLPTSFELVPPSVEEMAARIAKSWPRFPWLACDVDGATIGYAYASAHRDRAAYQWSVDVSVYVLAAARGQGIGRALYTPLFALLRAQGFVNAYAGVTLPNPASVGLHEAMGMTPVGIYRHVGFKAGAWHDVGWWQIALAPLLDSPTSPRTLEELSPDERMIGE
jgi:L-amino acid N-acyltransferase YncA